MSGFDVLGWVLVCILALAFTALIVALCASVVVNIYRDIKDYKR